MAGLSKYLDADKNFVILTTVANESMEDIHNRMPVLLYKEEIPNYLSSREHANYYLHRKPILLKRELVSKEEPTKKEEPIYDQLQLSNE
jgi:putative SOS response-associated peptidase YedK